MTGPIIRRFSRSSYRWTDRGCEPLGVLPGIPGGACVLPRESLLFARIDLASVPPRQRLDALKLELEQKSPFDELEGWVVWQEAQACVWYWSRQIEAAAQASLKEAAGRRQFLAEPALWPRLGPGSYRWVSDGERGLYLLQYCHPEKGLYEKRFARPVSSEEAAAWLRRHGATGAAAESPRSEGVPAFSAPMGQSLQPQPSSLEHRVFPVSAALLAFFAVAYGVAIIRADYQAQNTARQASQLEQQIDGVVDLRQRAGTLRTEFLALQAYDSVPQVQVAARIADMLDVKGGRLVRWAYRDGRLELSWEPEGELPDATRLITVLEESGAFSEVQAQTRGDSLVELSLQVEQNLNAANEVSGDE